MDKELNTNKTPWEKEGSEGEDSPQNDTLLAVKKFLDNELQLSDNSDYPGTSFRTDISHVGYKDELAAAGKNQKEPPVENVKKDRVSSGEFNLRCVRISPQAISLVPEWLALKYTVIPVEVKGNILVVAMKNPSDLPALSTIETVSGLRVKPQKAEEVDIIRAIQQNYKLTDAIKKKATELRAKQEAEHTPEPSIPVEADENAPTVRIIDMILKQALKDRASDIHIEPQANQLKVRFRIDGILHNMVQLPAVTHMSLLSRIKILSKLNIAEHRIPQDGQFTFKADGREVDIRVAIANTIHGETVVLRLLEKSSRLRTLSQLGLSFDSIARLEGVLKSPYGMILVGGPTGSGKTTTLYAAINELNKDELNIVTIEDPVEYHIDNIKSMQVNTKAGFTFASGLRSIMRLDPDVILVGEIRDSETAQIAVQAALTGHLVLSTVHANDATGIIYRMLNLGIEPFLLSSSLLCLISQRMVRKNCPHCCKTVKPSPQDLDLFKETVGEAPAVTYRGQGCGVCSNTGYYDRMGIFEILPVSENMRNLVSTNNRLSAVKQLARDEGMVSMLQDGMIKAKAGLTTTGEVIKNIYTF